jgi:hypothetical protein
MTQHTIVVWFEVHAWQALQHMHVLHSQLSSAAAKLVPVTL